ncbi:MAG: PH domain-containing protein [Candidatus Woesearchaeota archaeon]
MDFKPNKKAFFYPLIRANIILLIVFLVIGSIASLATPLAFMGTVLLWFLILSFSLYSRKVAYNKLIYTFTDNKIIAKGGGIFSDFESELTIRNITNVRKVLPFLQHLFYRTGNIVIDSAGSSGSQITMQALDNPDEVFKDIKKLMHEKGFSMSGEKLLLERSPDNIAVLLEVSGLFIIGGFFFFLSFVAPILAVVAGFMFQSTFYLVLGLFLLIILFIIYLVSFYINYSEKKQRIYRVYNDMITYYEGFLTKVEAVVPMENLSDTSLKQTFIDKILDLSDVTVSSQGTGQEIHFKNIKDGKTMSRMIDDASSSFKAITHKAKKEEKSQVKRDSPQRDSDYTANFQMDMKRTLLPWIPLCIIFLPMVFVVVSLAIKVAITRFKVKKESFVTEVSLFSTNTIEFSADKVTGIVYSKGILDRFFDTGTLQFWSIGSGQNLVFSNIKGIDIHSILAKLGIHPSEVNYSIQSKFSILDYLKRSIGSMIIVLLLVALASVLVFLLDTILILFAGIILLMIITVALLISRKRTSYSNLRFHKDYLYYKKGWFHKKHYYVLFDNIKDITTIRYPFSKKGDIIFNVAGETVIADSKGNKTVISSSFKIPFVPDIREKDELIDQIMHERPDKVEKKEKHLLLEARPSLANPLSGLLTVSIIIFPLILLLPITLPLTIIGVKRKSYRIEDFRVLEQKGILRRVQTSIVFSKIDHINTSRGMFNKLFGNGNITINTAGSSRPELIIKNIPNYTQFYEEINKYY